MTLRVGGLTPLSTTDWPGMLAAVVFCQGCPWRCNYCHNPDLIPPRGENEIPWEEVMAFLRRRQGLLDGVVFSGGEPTLQKNLLIAIREVRALGFRIGLHTGGMYPSRLATLLPWVDWVGMDVKAPFADYPRISGAAGSGGRARAGLQKLMQSGVEHEIRTTVHPALLGEADLIEIAHDLSEQGVRNYVLQAFRRQGCADQVLCRPAAFERLLQETGEKLAGQFEKFSVRA
ncbi:MAG: anaerobic ribonucleoside-triphosphate reductase activating protein [Thiobacillus sp.]